MTSEEIHKIVTEELKTKTLEITQQYLEIHNVIYNNEKPIIEHIDWERSENTIVAYLPVENEEFYYVVYIDTTSETIRSFGSEDYVKVYFRATSETMTLKELSSLTKLVPTESWNIGDTRKIGNSIYKFSSISFLPNPEPDILENKLNKLLDFLEQDKEGIMNLVEKAFGYIQVTITFHNATGMLGGAHIDKATVNRMNNLNLEIDFDLYAAGNPIQE